MGVNVSVHVNVDGNVNSSVNVDVDMDVDHGSWDPPVFKSGLGIQWVRFG